MNAMKKTGIVVGFYLAISVASLATNGLAWFITSRQAGVRVSNIGIANRDGRLIIEVGEEEDGVLNTPVVADQLVYEISDSLVGETGGGRKVRYVDVYGSSSGIAPMIKRAGEEVILRVYEYDGTDAQDYYFVAIDSDSDGNEDGVEFNKALPVNASSIQLHYTYDLCEAYAATRAMNINQGHPDYGPVGTEDSLAIHPEAIADVSSDGETFYRNTMSPDGQVISSVSNLTNKEKVYGNSGVGCYIQFTFWVINELATSKPVDIAITQNDNGDKLLSVEDNNADADEHYRMAIYDTTDPAEPEMVFFYEQKDWDANDHYVDSTTLENGENTVSYIGQNDIIDGSSFQVVKSYQEAGTVALPNNQLLYSSLGGGEHCSLTVRLWCEGTLCDNDDIAQICNANFNIVGYDHY